MLDVFNKKVLKLKIMIKKIIYILLIVFTSNAYSQVTDLYSFPYKKTIDDVNFVLTLNWGSGHALDSTNYSVSGNYNDTLIINCFFQDLCWAQPMTSVDTINMSDKLEERSYFVEIKIHSGALGYYNYNVSGYISRVLVSNSTSIKEIEPVKNDISIYPNPSNNKLFINYPNTNNEPFNLKTTSINGKFIDVFKQINGNNYTIDISKYPKGIYILEVETNNSSITKKFIKE